MQTFYCQLNCIQPINMAVVLICVFGPRTRLPQPFKMEYCPGHHLSAAFPGKDSGNAMSKWNMIIDVAECTNCQLCTLATTDEYVGNDFPGYAAPMPRHGHRWIDILQKERGQAPMIDIAYVPTMCNHCDDAPCIKAARDGAITEREDGIVLIDPVKANGQKELVEACPY